MVRVGALALAALSAAGALAGASEVRSLGRQKLVMTEEGSEEPNIPVMMGSKVAEPGEGEEIPTLAAPSNRWGDPWPNKPEDATHSSRVHTSAAYRMVKQAFTASECLQIVQIAGHPTEQKEDSHLRKTHEVKLIKDEEENRWIYHRVWGMAQEANGAQQGAGPEVDDHIPGWKFGKEQAPGQEDDEDSMVNTGPKLAGMLDLQVVVYKDGDHFDWHADEVTTPYPGMKHWERKVKVITMVVNLQSPKYYKGGQLQLGRVDDISREQGDAVFFPSYSLSKVHPVTKGTRVALVAHMTGFDEHYFWPAALNHYTQIVDNRQPAVGGGDGGGRAAREAELADELGGMPLSKLRKYAKATGPTPIPTTLHQRDAV